MAEQAHPLVERLNARFGAKVLSCTFSHGHATLEVAPEHWADVARTLRDDPEFRFEQLIDVCGVDYLGYGTDEWDTRDVSNGGFSRGVEGQNAGRFAWGEFPSEETGNAGGIQPVAVPARRFAAVAHLLSIQHNRRLRLRTFAADSSLPVVPSLVEVWPVSNWFEREAFDLFGIVFEGHPDLRRILTDYGFVGHPFRKDFPLIGNVEVRYDAEKGRVVYEPVSIEPRVLVPRTIRDDSRFEQAQAESAASGAK